MSDAEASGLGEASHDDRNATVGEVRTGDGVRGACPSFETFEALLGPLVRGEPVRDVAHASLLSFVVDHSASCTDCARRIEEMRAADAFIGRFTPRDPIDIAAGADANERVPIGSGTFPGTSSSR